ncbi:MAG: hypothetical protein GXY67_04175 [Clostridiales bacterium]|nr:hypothetical protein [Clostridiales bacterium]
MSNTISLFKNYVPILDEVYQQSSRTAILDGNPDLVQAGANANELIVPMLDMQGLGDYSRSSGYVDGDVTLTHQTIPVDYDRGRMFSVDNMDNAETAGIAFGRLSGEFIRTRVVPELDAYRLARYAGTDGIGKVAAGATLSTGAEVIAALRAGTNAMDEDEVPMEDRHLFITPTLLGLIQDSDSTKSREVLARFASIAQVPQTRFYTAITLKTGASGQTDGGYIKWPKHYQQAEATTPGALKVVANTATPSTGEIKASAVTPVVDPDYTPTADDYVIAVEAKDINFMIIHKAAVIQFPKHIAPKVITPELNQDADAWKFGYRIVGVNGVYENKLAGIYLHHK